MKRHNTRNKSRLISAIAIIATVPLAAACSAADPQALDQQVVSPAGQATSTTTTTSYGTYTATPGTITAPPGADGMTVKVLGGAGGASAEPHSGSGLGSSYGIHLYNQSYAQFVLTAVTGDNEGVPAVGDILLPNGEDSDYEDFEVTQRAAKTTTVTANYDVYDAADTQIGTALVKMSIDAIGLPSSTATFTPIGGFQMNLGLQNTSYYSPEFITTG